MAHKVIAATETQTEEAAKPATEETGATALVYGVSYGNGNDGTSQLIPDFRVRTDDPWTLARAALLSKFYPGAGQQWALQNMEVDGEAEFTVSATLYNPPCDDSANGEYPDSDNPEDEEDGRNWCDGNGAWMICEVFPCDDTERGPLYDSLAECFDSDVLALANED